MHTTRTMAQPFCLVRLPLWNCRRNVIW